MDDEVLRLVGKGDVSFAFTLHVPGCQVQEACGIVPEGQPGQAQCKCAELCTARMQVLQSHASASMKGGSAFKSYAKARALHVARAIVIHSWSRAAIVLSCTLIVASRTLHAVPVVSDTLRAGQGLAACVLGL